MDRSLPKLQVKQAVRFRVQKSIHSGQKAKDRWVPLEHGDGLLHRVAGDIPSKFHCTAGALSISDLPTLPTTVVSACEKVLGGFCHSDEWEIWGLGAL